MRAGTYCAHYVYPMPQQCVSAHLCLTLCDPMDCSLPGSSVHVNFPGNNPGVGCHFLLQGILPTQRRDLVSCVSCISRWILYHWTIWEAPSTAAAAASRFSHVRLRASPVPEILQARTLEWVAISFSNA